MVIEHLESLIPAAHTHTPMTKDCEINLTAIEKQAELFIIMRFVYELVHSKWLQMPWRSDSVIRLRKRYRDSLNDWVSRAEVWFSNSRDGGKSWSEPRLMFANTLAGTIPTIADQNY